MGFGVVWARDPASLQQPDALQQVVDDGPSAYRYFSDGFAPYAQLLYPGQHTVAPGKSQTFSGKSQTFSGKSQTFSVEGDSAERGHYLARLARKSRCFSRCIWALTRAVALFVYAWDRRQRFRRAFPKLPAEVCDFVADLI